jgi:hypothetical protein
MKKIIIAVAMFCLTVSAGIAQTVGATLKLWFTKIWGGGKGKAKPYFEKAKALFSKESKSDIFKPYWGEAVNEEFLMQCS